MQNWKVVFFGLALTACSGSGSSSSFQDTALSRIPKSTSPISTSSSSTSLVLASTANSGLPLATAASDEFGNSYDSFIAASDVGEKVKNFGACSSINFIRGALAQAAGADFLICLMGQLIPEEEVADFADGTEHVISVTSNEDGETSTYKLKFSATLDSNDQVTDFEMFVCQNGQQEEYVSQTISEDGTLSMTSVGSAEPDNPQVDSVVYTTSVSGTVNSANLFTDTKTITMRYQNDFASGQNSDNNHVEAIITQRANSITFNGYSCDKNTDDNSAPCDQESQLYSHAELLDQNTSAVDFNLNLYSLGHGAYVQSTGETATGWDADNSGSDDSSDASSEERGFVEDNKSDLLEVSNSFDSISFSGDQIWDCNGTSEASYDLEDGDACFGKLEINQDVHLECSDLN